MPSKRHRACEACHSAKVRCELAVPGSGISRPCRRCRKVGRECYPAAPRLQRNRIAELEAQVQALVEPKREEQDLNLESIPTNPAGIFVPTNTEQPRSIPVDNATPVFPLTQFATNVGIDVGISGLPQSTTNGPSISYLQRYAATSAIATIIRDVDSNPWTPFHDECLSLIRDSPEASSTDLLFCKLVVAERLCHHIASRSGLCGQSLSVPLQQDSMQVRSTELRLEIEKWSKGSVPQSIFTFYRHIAVMYLNESVLHTPSNKWTFGAPFVPERIAPGDFAAPAVTVDHIGSLYAIKDSCHAALDAAISLDPATDLSLVPVSFHPRVLYAIFILVKLYVAVTAPGNTYGTVLSKSELRLEEYFDILKSTTSTLSAGHGPASFSGMILTASAWLEHWFIGYKAIAEEYERRVNYELIWTPSVASTAQKFGLQMESSDHSIQPRDLIWVGEEDDDGVQVDASASTSSRKRKTKQKDWKQRNLPRLEPSTQSLSV